MKCFYHNADLDGHCSGAIVKHFHPECEMFGINYGDPFPFDKIEGGEKVYIVDFSLRREYMIWLNERTHLVWIDHHKSAIEEMEGLDIYGRRGTQSAACELCWGYFSKTFTPLPVYYLGRYDVWDHRDENVLPFQMGFRVKENTLPDSDIWELMFSQHHLRPLVADIIRDGQLILKYQEKQDQYSCKKCFDLEFEGWRGIARNGGHGSLSFKSVWDPKRYDLMIVFSMLKDNTWGVSLFSDKDYVDVSAICKKYGGGGHKGAGGFTCKSLDTLLPEIPNGGQE